MAAQRRDSFFVFYIVAFIVVAIAAFAVYSFWSSKQKRLDQETKDRAAAVEKGPLTANAITKQGPDFRQLSLLGEARPYKTATLYAKVSGYLARIAVDAGDHVKAGQFIAEINSPEVEAQYRGAVASLQNREKLADRTRDLAEKGFYSKQALDDAETAVQTQTDRVGEVKALQNYRTLVAPFAGVVTIRHVDPGALVTNATSNQSSSQPVVTISDTSKLRVTVFVDQSEAPYVKPGTKVEITDASNPSIKAEATVSRVSGELDPRTRTMATQVDFDNNKGTFIAGSFVTVSVMIPTKSYVEAPTPALTTREGKSYVAVIGADGHIKLTPVEIAGTDGKVIRIASGVAEGVRVALNLPNTISDGAKVDPAPPIGGPPAAAAPPATPPAQPRAAPTDPSSAGKVKPPTQ